MVCRVLHRAFMDNTHRWTAWLKSSQFKTLGRSCFADVPSVARYQKTTPAKRRSSGCLVGRQAIATLRHDRHRNEVSSGPCSLTLTAQSTRKLLTSLLLLAGHKEDYPNTLMRSSSSMKVFSMRSEERRVGKA